MRVPTGGGKTWLAAKSIELINRQLLQSEHSIILWLVPSNQIKEQTLKALKDREHLKPEQEKELKENETITYSLANVLRLLKLNKN